VFLCFILLWSGLLYADTSCGKIIISSGIADDRVFQRASDNKARINIIGTASPSTTTNLQFQIQHRTQDVEGFGWNTVPVDANGQWMLKIDTLLVGGPYSVKFRLLDSAKNELDLVNIENILVGDLWLLGGQSNMDGCGDLADAEAPSEMIHSFSLGNAWQVAEDPIHYCYESVYPVYLTSYVSPTVRRPIPYTPRGTCPGWKPAGNIGAGLGIPFAKAIFEKTQVPIGLIPCSLGGSTMPQWSPELKDKAGSSLYGAMLDRIEKVGGRIVGMLWYQGESDSDAEAAKMYQDRLKNLIVSICKDINEPNLSFYCVQIGRQLNGTENNPGGKDTVREAQRKCMLEMPGAALVSAIDLEMSSSAHIDTVGYKRVGRRLANLALALNYSVKEIKTGPMLNHIAFDPCKPNTIRVVFDNVNGKLIANPRVLGFSLRSENGTAMTVQILSAKLDPQNSSAIIITTLEPLKESTFLWYGWGWDPVCNVVDELDMALPAFGHVKIK